MAFTILFRFRAMAARRHSSVAARMPLFRIFEIQCSRFKTGDRRKFCVSGMPKRQWCREHGISYSTFMRWQRSLRNELAGEIMVTQAVVPLQIEPQASRCSPVQEVTIQKDGISISMHGASSDMVIAIVRGLSSC